MPKLIISDPRAVAFEHVAQSHYAVGGGAGLLIQVVEIRFEPAQSLNGLARTQQGACERQQKTQQGNAIGGVQQVRHEQPINHYPRLASLAGKPQNAQNIYFGEGTLPQPAQISL